ncbi:hypothetical protein D4764_18G0013090 [Takifugu flavidus]|uniref:Uncharacterized protein n=1 Tax=Takifugu flavidus TaxID=433684 RepID=A0A5C6NTA1_9TELE|nr:hypothetical protein D4764_18G0013090 [Takifugu flavidus]
MWGSSGAQTESGGALSRQASLPTHRQLLSRDPLCSSLGSASPSDDSSSVYTPPTPTGLMLATNESPLPPSPSRKEEENTEEKGSP